MSRTTVCLLLLFLVDISAQDTDFHNCNDPIEPGRCRAYIPRWAWDTRKEDCVQFIYGGCGANGNNFYTKEACVDTCMAQSDPIHNKDGVCPVVDKDSIGSCQQECEKDSECDGENKCCSNGCGRMCQAPVFAFNDKAPLPGSCPKVSTDSIGVCMDSCSCHSQCKEGQMCCFNGCGHTCIDVKVSTQPHEMMQDKTVCDHNWSLFNGSCYHFVGYSRSYHQAFAECYHEHVDSQLADLKTLQQYEWLYDFLDEQHNFIPDIGVWIGLHLEENQWVWSDGSPLTYANKWATGEPKGSGPCITIHKTYGGMCDVTCDHKKQYICQYDPKRTMDDSTHEPAVSGEHHAASTDNRIKVDMYILSGIIFACVFSIIAVAYIVHIRCRRRVVKTGDKKVKVVKYDGYEPMLL
ncbi:uncharacterized protein LOC102804263 [Saccoglossus kowalevskii]|uniref:Uncharacterized protein LOC102804263 n=1 Tax=Saccoglossus kowalevskii TaxID=10224 RepID=A0ABM0LTU2_SACKO|nr:PREDICTED: uncharacterized protein LOC102804263 [Saccoglossus kowalevskii]